MNRPSLLFFIKITCLLVITIATAFLLFDKHYVYAVLLFIVLIVLAHQWLQEERKLINHVLDFSEAVHYRDFTRRFVVKHPKTTEGRLFAAFNEINEVYKQISVDKEIQHQYLTKVINMLDSALLFYKVDTQQVIWINDSFKQLFQTPHLGNLRGLVKRHPELYEKTIAMKTGNQQIETAGSSVGKVKLLTHSSEFETNDGVFRIVMYQNINEAIDETETKAWQKLLRVLTHEIMNSIAPISSLAETLHGRLENGIVDEDIDDLKVGIHTIKKRSEGLLQFAKSYRQINKVDQPERKDIALNMLFEDVYQLLEPTLLQKNIDVDIILKDRRLMVHADPNLLEQVLINLLLNAIEAVKDSELPYISITGMLREGNVAIRIQDNGSGMSEEIQDQIFTPFFTTRKSGSGVGLTLSKQIMLLHNGNLLVESKEGEGAAFTLQF